MTEKALTPVQAFLQETIRDSSAMFDRVARVNAPLVLARNEPLTTPDGYRNPRLHRGYNIVLAVLFDLAMDQGLSIDDILPPPTQGDD